MVHINEATSEIQTGEEAKQVESASATHHTRSKNMEPLMKVAVAQGLIPPSTSVGPCADFYDLDALDARLAELRTAFHESFFTHCLAVKANPMRGILSRVVASGCGLECASIGEVMHSRSLSAPLVVYDSPCKCRDEMRDVLLNMKNVYMNLDNEQEIAEVDSIVKENPGVDFSGRIGLRINPATGAAGTFLVTSTVIRSSKFGLPLTPETKMRLLEIYRDHPWLQGVHVHAGSQGCSLELLTGAMRTAMDFVKEIEELRGARSVKVVDIGGGLPTSYTEDQEAYTFASYRSALEATVPEVFSGDYRILTEFGRCVFTKPGLTASRIAAVKGAPWHPGTPLAIAHVGSNQFIREAYLGDQWKHRFTAFDSNGAVHADAKDVQHFDIAGPLCFQGDYIGRKQYLPRSLNANDIVVMHDTGGYTMAMYSKYNSRQCHAVYGFRRDSKNTCGFSFVVLKERETIDEALAFWGPEQPRVIANGDLESPCKTEAPEARVAFSGYQSEEPKIGNGDVKAGMHRLGSVQTMASLGDDDESTMSENCTSGDEDNCVASPVSVGW